MAFPSKFRHLIELKKEDVEQPDETWLAYSVCACDEKACGWQGWIVESVSRMKRQLKADTEQICPQCRRQLFRTEAKVRLVPSPDQTPDLVPGKDYDVVPIEYED